mgnify:CR=1 FL=1
MKFLEILEIAAGFLKKPRISRKRMVPGRKTDSKMQSRNHMNQPGKEWFVKLPEEHTKSVDSTVSLVFYRYSANLQPGIDCNSTFELP